MTKYCCVPFCKSKSKTLKVTLHAFTKDPKLLNLWIHNIKRDTRKSQLNPKPFRVSKNTKICSLHFEKHHRIINSEKCRLKSGAIPTIFSWVESNKRHPLESEATQIADDCRFIGQATTSIDLDADDIEAARALITLNRVDETLKDVKEFSLFQPTSCLLQPGAAATTSSTATRCKLEITEDQDDSLGTSSSGDYNKMYFKLLQGHSDSIKSEEPTKPNVLGDNFLQSCTQMFALEHFKDDNDMIPYYKCFKTELP